MEDVRREQIGIVGVGNMGGAIARSMLREGISLTAFDLNEAARGAIADLGASIAPTLDALAATCKVISIVVVTDEQVRDVGQQIVSQARPGTIVLIHSTIRPGTVVDLAALGAEREVSVLDVSVNGGNEKAALGTLTLMVGGPGEVVDYVWPLLETFGQNIFHMGPVGSGVVGKLVNNLIALGSYALQMEAMRLATLPPAQQADALVKEGDQFLNRGLILEAEREFQSALAANPSSATAHAGLAQVREHSRDMDAARQEAQKSLAIAPNVPAHLVLARLDLAANQLAPAATEVSQALKIEPANANARGMKQNLESRGQQVP